MSQNIYDDPDFFEGYSQLPRSVQGLAGAPEWPSVRTLLPDLQGLRILDLGCGFGAFDRWAIAQGANRVVAVDLSERMLSRARSLAAGAAIDYRRADMSDLTLPERGFDLIYSALAFHYVQDFPALCRTMRGLLRAGGWLVATVEHPVFSAPRDDNWREQDGRSFWPLDGYLNEGTRTRHWFADGVIKHHRTISTYVNDLLDSSFRLQRLIEWGPDEAQIASHPEWARERERPMFLLFSALAVA